jgi:hypothetical protein
MGDGVRSHSRSRDVLKMHESIINKTYLLIGDPYDLPNKEKRKSYCALRLDVCVRPMHAC